MIEKQWREFCLACFGDIGEQQYIDLRRTFYGGALALYFVILGMLDPGQEPTEADVIRISEGSSAIPFEDRELEHQRRVEVFSSE